MDRAGTELLLGERMLRSNELHQADPLAMEACSSIDAAGWQSFGCLPLRQFGERLVVAIPADWGPDQRQALSSAVAQAGLETDLRPALKQEIEAVLASRRLEGHRTSPPPGDPASVNPGPVGALPPPPARLSLLEDLSLDDQLDAAPEEQDAAMNLEENLSASSASPVVSLVNRILIQALDTDSSDIHVEPQEDGLQIRYIRVRSSGPQCAKATALQCFSAVVQGSDRNPTRHGLGTKTAKKGQTRHGFRHGFDGLQGSLSGSCEQGPQGSRMRGTD